MNESTPGPWICELSQWTGAYTVYAGRTDVGIRVVAEMHGIDAQANGRLAAAAPDMLAELHRSADTLRDTANSMRMLRHDTAAEAMERAEKAMRETIAKAQS